MRALTAAVAALLPATILLGCGCPSRPQPDAAPTDRTAELLDDPPTAAPAPDAEELCTQLWDEDVRVRLAAVDIILERFVAGPVIGGTEEHIARARAWCIDSDPAAFPPTGRNGSVNDSTRGEIERIPPQSGAGGDTSHP